MIKRYGSRVDKKIARHRYYCWP